jgi:hypothetical protein
MYYLASQNESNVMEFEGNGIQNITKGIKLSNFGFSLVTWSRIVGFVYCFMAGVMGLMIYLQTSDIVRPTRLMARVTRTAGVWVNDNTTLRQSVVVLGNNIRLNDGCSLLDLRLNPPDQVVPVVLNVGHIDARYLVLTLYVFSALYHLVFSFDRYTFNLQLCQGVNHVSHFVEFSVSISVTILVICIQLGMTDLFSMIGAVSGIWCSMVFGMLAELLHRDETFEDSERRRVELFDGVFIPNYVIAHVSMWLSAVSAVSVTLSNIINSESCFQKSSSDSYWIIGQTAAYIETVFLVLICLTQSFYLSFKPGTPVVGSSDYNDISDVRIWWSCVVEFLFIMFSLVAKLISGILIYVASVV